MDVLSDYISFTDAIVDMTGSTHNMMHIHAGMTIYLLVLLISRRLRAFPMALFLVAAIALLHEALERLYYGSWRIEDTLTDIMLTLMWPAAITMIVLLRSRYRARPSALRHGIG